MKARTLRQIDRIDRRIEKLKTRIDKYADTTTKVIETKLQSSQRLLLEVKEILKPFTKAN